MPDASDFVVIRAFTYPFEAHLACSALEAAGIEAKVSDSRDREPDSASTEPCPRCGSDDVSVSTDERRAFLSWLAIGLPLFPASRRVLCRRCGHSFRRKRYTGK
ncbi:MAG TPA: hypothetical protein VGJ78_20535, partial [Vicinamibacterales bacterium]